MNNKKSLSGSMIGIRIVLVLAGLFIIYTGINVAFGGMFTLGLQGQTDFMQVTNEQAYLVQDSHIRFIGGLWLGIGILFIVAAFQLMKYKEALSFSLLLIFLGGLSRLTQMDIPTLVSQNVAGSLAAELIGVPLLFLWLNRLAKQQSAS